MLQDLPEGYEASPTRENPEGPDFGESTPDRLAERQAARRTDSNDKAQLAL